MASCVTSSRMHAMLLHAWNENLYGDEGKFREGDPWPKKKKDQAEAVLRVFAKEHRREDLSLNTRWTLPCHRLRP
jgi:hypothetical protein